MKIKYIIFNILLISILASCSDDNQTSINNDNQLKVTLTTVLDMQSHSPSSLLSRAGSDAINDTKVESISLFVFDQESNLLQGMEQNVQAKTPEKGAVVGEAKIADIVITVPDSKPKNILAIANSSTHNVTYPALSIGVTTYEELSNAVVKIADSNELVSPYLMTGYANRIDPTQAVSISLRRKVAKLTVDNIAKEKGLTINSMQLIGATNSIYLFNNEAVSNAQHIDYELINAPANKTSFYVYPSLAANNKLQLKLSGTIHGNSFAQVIDVKPSNAVGIAGDIKSNYRYVIKLDATGKNIELKTSIETVEEWIDGTDIPGIITDEDSGEIKLIHFNGMQWADRNLGATSNDLELDWTNSIGKFYQWGRNVAFSTIDYQVVSGPLASIAEAESEVNKDKFIAGGFKDWINYSDNTLWQNVASQPTPDGLRLPTDAELQGIFTARGVIMNMITGPKIVTDEKLTAGIHTAHYWGDNTMKRVYGVKCQGTDKAYYMQWEYLKTAEGNPYLKISRWDAHPEATFEAKPLTEIRNYFNSLPPTQEVLILPGAGYITGSNGSYSKSEGGYYWSYSLAGDNKVFRAEFNTGRASMTEPYASRISGHTIRCVAY